MFVRKLLSFLFLPDAALQIWLESRLKCFTGAMNEGFRRRERTTQHFGDLFVAQFLLPTQSEGYTLVFRQCANHSVHLVFQLALEQLVLRATDTSVHYLEQWLVV